MVCCQKLGIIIENKRGFRFEVVKNVNNKKCVPKKIFFNEKKFTKITKIHIILDIEK